jgi:hypothetical protein
MAIGKEATSGGAKGNYVIGDVGADLNDLSKNGQPCIIVSGR